MASTYDLGATALDDLIEWADSNVVDSRRNGADTRLHLIDTLLMHVLRWPRAAVRAETPTDSGRIDYALGEPAIQCVIEAKREGVAFDLPAGLGAGVHSIESICSGAGRKSIRDALEQVRRYAAERGVAPAGVSNGHQLIVFIATRSDGIPPLQGKALAFPSLADMRSEFRLLWDALSPHGIDSRNLHTILAPQASIPPEPPSAEIVGYPGTKRRNDLQAGLEILSELFLEDVTRLEELRVEFLRDYYAKSGALSQYAEISKQILKTRYALLHEETSWNATHASGKKGELSPALTQDALAAATSARPIVLLGDVGAGKTTFIQRLVNVDADELFRESISLYIDFGSSVTVGQLDIHVINESIEQLRVKYDLDIEAAEFAEAVHNAAISRFDKGVIGKLKDIDPTVYERERIDFLRQRVGDRAGHLKASLEHLRQNRRKQIVIFLDNIDQRASEDQERVFLIANELARTWPATVFVTLRPETFYRSSRDGAISGYHPRVFTISPPRADKMLQRRVDFALKQLKASGRLGSFPAGVTVDSESLIAFLEVLAENFRSNQDLLALIDNLAGGNMRMALQFVTSFIGSGHVDTSKIIRVWRESGQYTIPLHEFLRALLFGDGKYFEPESSPIANLFRVSKADGRERFLLPLLLSHVKNVGEGVGEECFVNAEELYTFAQGMGFEPRQIASAVDHAVRKRLLEVSPRFTTGRSHLHYRITTVGEYTMRVLLAYFTYVDAVLIDTPIVDDQYRNLITDVHDLSERLSRSTYFRTYLDRQWSKVAQPGLPWDWSRTSERLNRDIHAIGRKTDPSSWG